MILNVMFATYKLIEIGNLFLGYEQGNAHV